MNDYEWLRLAAKGELPADPVGDAAVDIMDCIVRNLAQGIATHDIQHHADIEEIILRHFPQLKPK